MSGVQLDPGPGRADRKESGVPGAGTEQEGAMSQAGRKLCFVVGHYKSGSTWLVNLLSLHPEIRGVSETHALRYSAPGSDLAHGRRQLFESVAWADGGVRRLPRHLAAGWSRPLRKALGLARGQASLSAAERPTTIHDLGVGARGELARQLERCDDGDAMCRAFFDFLLERLRPGRYLVEKTPTNMPHVPRIRQLFPECKLVSVHRDGRDVVVSDKYHLARQYGKARRFEDRVERWRDAMQEQVRYAPEHRIHTIGYETMLESPREVVVALLDHLELPTENAVVDDMIHRSSFEFVTGRSRGQGDAKAFYRKGVAGDWRNHYTDAEKRIFSELAGDLLVHLGYEREADWRTWS